MSMMPRPRSLVLLAGLLALAAPLNAMAQSAEAPMRTITVQGTGESVAVPDMASISLGVTTEGRSAAHALEQNSRAMTTVIEVLGEAGIEPRDIATSSVSLSPVYDQRPNQQGRREIRGYRASNQVRV
ncbi:MAG: SIMPL domain-containing protein, partial [Pseudomonadota bacterium]